MYYNCKKLIYMEILKTEAKGVEDLKPATDQINPSHYKDKSIETIDKMVRIWGPARVADHCDMCAFKYRERIGNKPGADIEAELGKIKWYEAKSKELRAFKQKQDADIVNMANKLKAASIIGQATPKKKKK